MLFNRTFALSAAKQLHAICAPLRIAGVSYFGFVRRFARGKQIHLSTDPAWLSHYFGQRHYQICPFQHALPRYFEGYTLWQYLTGQALFEDAKANFGIEHGMTFIKVEDGHTDFFHFATQHQDKADANFYFNNVDLLHRFTKYFYSETYNLLKQAMQYAVHLPVAKSEKKYFEQQKIEREAFIRATQIKRLPFQNNQLEDYLTPREIDCLICLVEGKTAKQTAKQFALSYRTVETHISNVKNKLQCRTKVELIERLIKMGMLFGTKKNLMISIK